jgi:hypothetical protein
MMVPTSSRRGAPADGGGQWCSRHGARWGARWAGDSGQRRPRRPEPEPEPEPEPRDHRPLVVVVVVIVEFLIAQSCTAIDLLQISQYRNLGADRMMSRRSALGSPTELRRPSRVRAHSLEVIAPPSTARIGSRGPLHLGLRRDRLQLRREHAPTSPHLRHALRQLAV